MARALKNVGEVHLVVASENNDTDAMDKAASDFQLNCNMRMNPLPHQGVLLGSEVFTETQLPRHQAGQYAAPGQRARTGTRTV